MLSKRSMVVAVILVVVVLASLAFAVAHHRAAAPTDSPGERVAAAEAALDAPIAAKASRPKSDTVYITKTGAKYHRSGCRSLRKSSIPISRAAAIRRGYAACKICSP
jgi:hypothetical protein